MACNIPAPQLRALSPDSEDQGVATFLIADIKGDSLPAKIAKNSAVPQNKTFNFTVCVKDQAHSRPLIDHPFRIEGVEPLLKTDEKGCLNWSEEIAFNFLSAPQYLEWKKRITAAGLHRGTRVARFAINPWNENDNSEAVVNLAKVTPPHLTNDPALIQAALQGSSENSKVAQNALWVNNISLQSTEQKFTPDQQVLLNFELIASPQLQITKLNGEEMLRNIPQGRFKLKFYLIHILQENSKEVHRLLAESDSQTLEMKGGSLFIGFPLKLSRLPTVGQLALALDISGEGENKNMGNFQGIYTLGDYDQYKGSRFLRLMNVVTEKKDFKISNFINSSLKEAPANSSGNEENYVKPKVEIQPLEFQSFRIGKESFANREIIFNVKACFKNNLDQKILRGFTFKINGFHQDENGSGANITRTTDNTSCVNWDETLAIRYYECHRHVKGFIEIENKELALKEKIAIALNPWESSGPLARDLRYMKDQETLVTDCKNKSVLPAMIILKNLSFSTLSSPYEIDHLLNMTVKKKYRFKIDTEVNTFSNMNRGRTDNAERLRPGVFLLKFALVKNRDYYNEKTYITSAEKLISTSNGDLRGDFEFKTADLKALRSHDTLLVELDPVKEELVTIDRDGNITPREKVASLDELIDRSPEFTTRTFSTVWSLGEKSGFLEFDPVDYKVLNEYLLKANSSPQENKRSSLVREYIEYGEKMAIADLQAQKAQSDILLFAKNNSLKHLSLKDAQTSEELRAAFAKGSLRLDEAQVMKELSQLVSTGRLSKELSKGFCSFWFKSFISKDLWGFFAPHTYNKCNFQANRPEKVFIVEKRLFVKELENYRFLGGTNYPLSVGNSISLGRSASHSTSTSKSLSLSASIPNLLGAFTKIFSVGISGSYTISQSDDKSRSSSNNVSVNTSIPLQLEKNPFQLKFKRYEECSTIKINPAHFLKGGLFASALKPSLSEAEKTAAASRGLMICTGTDNTTPLVREENYYLLSQGAGDITQDSGDLRNLQFFIALRGEKEFQRLMYFMKGTIKTPETADRSSSEHENNSINLKALFNSGHSNVPGSYNDTP